MRVVHLLISLAIGGLEEVVVKLARKTGPRFKIHVVCLESIGPLAEKLAGAGISIECVGDPNTTVLQSVRALRKRLDALRPDVLHTHNEKAHIHGALATLGRRTPVLIHTRHGRGQVEGATAGLANRLAVHRSRFVVCVSADSGDVARAEGARPDQLRVVRNAIEVSRYDPSGYARRANAWRAVTVARLAAVKDLGTMLRAVRIIVHGNPKFRLDIVGDGPARPELQRLAQELGLNGAVKFHGAQRDPRPFLSTATVFMQSSLSEGISLTLLEAMAAGVPVVATSVGGNREVVAEGETGLLVSPRDPGALAAAVTSVLSTPALASAMSQAARERAEREFDLGRMVAEYEALYDEALGRTPQ